MESGAVQEVKRDERRTDEKELLGMGCGEARGKAGGREGKGLERIDRCDMVAGQRPQRQRAHPTSAAEYTYGGAKSV